MTLDINSIRYLDIATEVYGLDGTEPVEITDDMYADRAAEVLTMVKGKGIEHFDIGCDDGVLCIFDEGELKLTAYISTRGSLFQAGAYDGEKGYYAHNLQIEDGRPPANAQWHECSLDVICASIAKTGWDELKQEEQK